MTGKVMREMRTFQRLLPLVLAGVFLVCSLFPVFLRADFQFPDELETDPDPPTISDGEFVTIRWDVTSSDGSFSTGTYQIEIGGTGEIGSGTVLESGTIEAGVTVETIIRADELGDTDDNYKIYFIVTNNEDSDDQDFIFQSVTLDNPPDPPADISIDWGDEKIEVNWTRSPDNDIDYYLVYYGTDSENYNGANSPVNVGDVQSYTITGLVNGNTYYIAVKTVDTHANESDFSDEYSAVPQETMGLGDLSDEEGGCFIATAAYGNADDPTVRHLRMFRDRVLDRSGAGRAFIRIYYRASPPLAWVLKQSYLLRTATRTLLGPVGKGAEKLSPEGGE